MYIKSSMFYYFIENLLLINYCLINDTNDDDTDLTVNEHGEREQKYIQSRNVSNRLAC